MNKVFSLPINPKFNPQFIETKFLDFLKINKDYIFDLYFTCRMPPFTQDAMGELFMSQDMEMDVIGMAQWLSDESGIPISATFNNIYVRPDEKNLKTWITNFKELYDLGDQPPLGEVPPKDVFFEIDVFMLIIFITFISILGSIFFM